MQSKVKVWNGRYEVDADGNVYNAFTGKILKPGMQSQQRDEWLSSDTLISQVDKLQEERRDLWKQVDELRAEVNRLQCLAIAYGAPRESVQ